jgi:hypothetical protein
LASSFKLRMHRTKVVKPCNNKCAQIKKHKHLAVARFMLSTELPTPMSTSAPTTGARKQTRASGSRAADLREVARLRVLQSAAAQTSNLASQVQDQQLQISALIFLQAVLIDRFTATLCSGCTPDARDIRCVIESPPWRNSYCITESLSSLNVKMK